MSRPQGSRNRLVTLDYDRIAEMAGGINGDTPRKYAQRGQFDSRDLDSVLAWVNRRRAARGLALIGLPDGDNQTASDGAATPVEVLPPQDSRVRMLAAGLVYDRMTGEFKGLYDG
jgi:hypothetical protein